MVVLIIKKPFRKPRYYGGHQKTDIELTKKLVEAKVFSNPLKAKMARIFVMSDCRYPKEWFIIRDINEEAKREREHSRSSIVGLGRRMFGL